MTRHHFSKLEFFTLLPFSLWVLLWHSIQGDASFKKVSEQWGGCSIKQREAVGCNSLRQCLFNALSLWLWSLQKEGTTHCSSCSTCLPLTAATAPPMELGMRSQCSFLESSRYGFCWKLLHLHKNERVGRDRDLCRDIRLSSWGEDLVRLTNKLNLKEGTPAVSSRCLLFSRNGEGEWNKNLLPQSVLKSWGVSAALE